MIAPTDATGIYVLGCAGLLSSVIRVPGRARQLALDYGVFLLFGTFGAFSVWLFLNHDSRFVWSLLRRYWLVALFGVFVLEGAMLLYFAPSESLVPVAIGMAISTDIAPATTSVYVLVIATAVAGATVGQFLLYSLVKRWGRERLLTKPWFRVGPETLDRFDTWFSRWGILAVPVSNTLIFTRGMLTVPAGLAGMDNRRFVILSASGTCVFETVLALLTLGVFNLGVL